MSNRDELADELTEAGIPYEAITRMVAEQFAPAERAFGALLWAKSHPDLAPDVVAANDLFLRDAGFRARVERLAETDADAALEMAVLKVRHERATERSRASRPPAYTPEPAYPPEPRPYGSPVEDARREYERTGSPTAAKAYAKARLRTVISDEFLNQ